MNPLWSTDSKKTGAEDKDILAWEALHQARLPESLGTLLRQHNGGTIGTYCAEIDVFPVDAIVPVGPSLLEQIMAAETPDEWAMMLSQTGLSPEITYFHFAQRDNYIHLFATPPGSNEARCFGMHCGDDNYLNDEGNFDTWSEKEWPSILAQEPTVDWSETRRMEILAEHECLQHGWIRLRQIIGRLEGQLWLYVHELRSHKKHFEWECISKTFLPEPLNARQCSIEKEGHGVFRLHFSVSDFNAVQEHSSSRIKADGGWLSEKAERGQRTVFYASDSALLEKLREDILGTDGAALAELRSQREGQVWGGLNSLIDEVRPLLEPTTIGASIPPQQAKVALAKMLEGAGTMLLPRLLKMSARLLKNSNMVK